MTQVLDIGSPRQKQTQTQANSPVKKYSRSTLKRSSNNMQNNDDQDLIKTGVATTKDSFNCLSRLSLTERQILSHQLIEEVLQKSKKNTIQHYVNAIPNNLQLYSIPLQHQNITNLLPSANNLQTLSTASQKVKQIHERLSDKRDVSQRLEQLAKKNIQQYKNELSKNKSSYKNRQKRPNSASNEGNINKRISVSGLISHKFNSVTARRSLGCIPDIPQQAQILLKVQQTKKRINSSRDREAKIINRKPNQDNLYKMQLSKAATCDFTLPTNKFLQQYIREGERRKHVYGQKMQKLDCIKQYMNQQGAQYGEAKHIVQVIINSSPKKIKQKQIKKAKIIDDQYQLSKRRLALSRKKIMLRHLYFTE